MVPPPTGSPFPYSDLGNLLALLELARVGHDPIDNPIPWAWEAWREGLRSECAPWQQNASHDNTHMPELARDHSRVFVIAYHASGRNLGDHVRFATELTDSDGNLFKGREWLSSWWGCQRYGDIIKLDDRIHEVLTKQGILTKRRSVLELDIRMLSGHPHPVVALGQGLFGDDTWSSEASNHPAVIRWLRHTLDMSRRDWILIHDDNHRRVDRARHMIFTMCQAVASHRCTPLDITCYVNRLGYIVEMMDFLREHGRLEQVAHYRKILYAIEESMGGWGASTASPLLPPAMVRVLAAMPSAAYRELLKSEVTKCLKMLDLRAVEAPIFPVDVYDLLSKADVGFLAGHFGEGYQGSAEHGALEHQDEDTVAGLDFARCTLPRVW